MKRRIIATLALGAFCVAASAQKAEPTRRVAYLGLDSAMQATRVAAFRDELRRRGYVEGANLELDYRSVEGQFDRLPAVAAELVAAKPDVIVTASPPAVRAAMQATSTIPIVISVHDAVSMGFVGSLGRPGGNVTGVAFQDSELSTKRLELLRGVVPELKRLAIVWNVAGGGPGTLHAVENAARTMKIETRAMEVRGPDDLVAAVAAAKSWGAQGMIQLASPLITKHRKALLDALASHRLPASCEMKMYVDEGCLMAYGADLDKLFRAKAAIAARILKGEKAADIAVEQPREFDFIVNLKTAEKLGISIPPAILLQTTERIAR